MRTGWQKILVQWRTAPLELNAHSRLKMWSARACRNWRTLSRQLKYLLFAEEITALEDRYQPYPAIGHNW